MKNIFNQIATDLGVERNSKLSEYYKLLARIDLEKPSERDRKQLVSLMSSLRKSAADAQSDHVAVMSHVRAVGYAGDKVKADEKYREAEEAYLAGCAERQRQTAEINAKISGLLAERDEAHANLQQSTEARQQLTRLQKSDPVMYEAVTGGTATVAEEFFARDHMAAKEAKVHKASKIAKEAKAFKASEIAATVEK